MSGSESDIYEEIWRVARAVYAAADLRSKPFRLEQMDLSTLYSLRMGSIKQGNHENAVHVSLEIVKREIASARRTVGPKPHARVLLGLVSLLRTVAGQSKGVSAAARVMSKNLVGGLGAHPEWLENYLRNVPKAAQSRDVKTLTGLDADDWHAFVARVVEATAERKKPAAVRIADAESRPVDLNVAARLSRLAAREESSGGALPNYDTSDHDLRISCVTVTGFRGSAQTVALDFTKNGKPVDVLLWGDNGVGKSTLVDGIEFALQGRVDRSADFNSSLRASVRNLTAPKALATVKLSDGSVVERSLVTNKAGRDEPSDYAVRPGFRVAPVAIRRADILRFLDTDALARGTVFFDYFPDPNGAGVLGVRPDEELKTLEEERFLLRVARDDLVEQLGVLYPDAGVDFTSSANLDAFVEHLLAHPGSSDVENLPGDPLGDARGVIGQLRSTQQRLSGIKKKLDRGVETLNPVAYKSQLARIVPILRAVTGDLTESFKRITRAEHVHALRVLVAKSGPVSLDVVVEFDNGTSALPQQAFSEGYKDLIALLFFLSVTKKASEFGQSKVLVLDDALQSVDATIRLGVMDYVLEEFRDWQLIVTGHDRAWYAQLRGLFSRRGRSVVERTISRWSFAGGIELTGASRTRADSVREALAQHDERLTASATGLLLEETAQELSWRLWSSVTRREGDRYTIGDLWPGVSKVLRSTSLKETVRTIDLRLDIRNLLGAHYNEWADGIPWSDIQRLADDVLAVYEAVYCTTCANWVRKSGREYSCQCGAVTLS